MSLTVPTKTHLELASAAPSESTESFDPASPYSYSDLLHMMAERHPSTKTAALCRQQLSQYNASREHVRESFSRLAFPSTWTMWISMNKLLQSQEYLRSRDLASTSESEPSESTQGAN